MMEVGEEYFVFLHSLILKEPKEDLIQHHQTTFYISYVRYLQLLLDYHLKKQYKQPDFIM